jgi:ATP-dependent Clp protease ATP-binding subunit ClpX
MGFRNATKDEKTEGSTSGETILTNMIPDDLLKYGLIPEFVGRLPVEVALDSLDKNALIRILTEPKNAIIKQYQKLLQLDRVELIFNNDALEAASESALRQRTGARGLRTIIEDVLLDVMYEIPSRGDVKKVIINGDVINTHSKPLLVTRSERNSTTYSENESA